MPIRLRPKARAKAMPVRKPKPAESFDSFDWLGLWALSLGFCAIVLAGVAYFLNGDNTGASCILTGAAVLIAVIIHSGADRDEAPDEN